MPRAYGVIRPIVICAHIVDEQGEKIVRDTFKAVIRMAKEKSGYETGGFDIMKQFQKRELKKQRKEKGKKTEIKKED